MSGNTPTARYSLNIVANTGYESTTEGECTPHQYSMALAALHSAPHTSQELTAQRDELLSTLKVVATIAHFGGLEKLSEADALTKVRRATVRYLDFTASDDHHRATIAKVPD